MEQEPWWKRQEREARERNQRLNDEWEEEKERKQRLKEERDKRPESIKIFEKLFLGSLGVEFLIHKESPNIFFEEICLGILKSELCFLYWEFSRYWLLHASRNQSNIAKWIIIILTGVSILTYLLFIPEIISSLISMTMSKLQVFQTGQTFLECAALILFVH